MHATMLPCAMQCAGVVRVSTATHSRLYRHRSFRLLDDRTTARGSAEKSNERDLRGQSWGWSIVGGARCAMVCSCEWDATRCGVVPERATRLLAKANHHLRPDCSCAMLTAVVPRVPEVVHIREPRVDDGAGETVAIGAARLVAVEPRLVLITRVVKQPDDNAGAAEGVARPAACPHGVDVRKWVERWRWWRLSRWEWVGRWRRCRR